MYIKQHLDLKSPAILTMTYGSCDSLHSVSMLLHSLKVDVQLNKNQKRDTAGVYLASRIKQQIFKGMLALVIVVSRDVNLNSCAFE